MAKLNGKNGHGQPGHNSRGTIRLYRRYNYQGHDPKMDEVMSIIAREGLDDAKAAVLSGVGRGTISNWRTKKTSRPQHTTMAAALAGMGYEFQIKKVKKFDYDAEMVKALRWHERLDAKR